MAKKKTFENIISNLLGEPVCNLCHAFYDQYVEANVKFRSRAGMKEVIIRRQLGKCCKWCADLAGIYTPDNAPADIYRRHDNCKCMVTYKDEDGYTDVWSKEEFESQKEARKVREKELIIFQRNKSKARIASKNTDYNEYIESVKGKENKLSMKHKLLLSKTPKKLSWCLMKAKKVDITDLPALTAATGDEFAIFEKGKHRILLRGSGPNWEIPDDLWETIVKEKWRWNGHSHPVKGKAIASAEDRKTLRLLTWQNESYIINLQGEIFEFNPDEQDWFNTILGVK